MIPEGDFIVGQDLGELLSIHRFTLGLNTSRARGGSDIGVAADGLDVADWTGRVDVGSFKITGPGGEVTVVAVPGAESATFAFDRNMNPAVCWNAADGARLYWFDSAIPGYTTTHYADITSAMVVHDDVRDIAESRSDVVMIYQRDGGIYARQQRERYLVEHTVLASGAGRIERCGMGAAGRLLVEMG